jgi:hypothetical protein
MLVKNEKRHIGLQGHAMPMLQVSFIYLLELVYDMLSSHSLIERKRKDMLFAIVERQFARLPRFRL